MAKLSYDIKALCAQVVKHTLAASKLEFKSRDTVMKIKPILDTEDLTKLDKASIYQSIKIARAIFITAWKYKEDISEAEAIERMKTDKALENSARRYRDIVVKKCGHQPLTNRGRPQGSTSETTSHKTTKNTVVPPVTSVATATTKKVSERDAFKQYVESKVSELYAFHEKNKSVQGCDDLHHYICDTFAKFKLLK